MSISSYQSPGIEMPNVRKNLESAFSNEQEEDKSENMCVFARVRPMLQSEEDAGYSECIAVVDDTLVRAVAPKSSAKFKNVNHNGQEIIEDFTYTQAFGPETGQFMFFEQTIMSTMESFIEGQNCLVFSYGITNSGKTYTLQGDENNPGIIILGLRLFFASIEHQLWNDIYAKPDKFADIILLSETDKMKEIQLRDYLLQIYNQEVNRSCDSSANLTKSFAMSLCDHFSDKFKPTDVEETLPPDEMEAAQCAALMKIKSKQSADKQIGRCNIWISFIEIYNEYIYDLLEPNVLERKKLNLAEDQNGDVYVKGAKEVYAANVDDAIKLLHLGRRNLRIASTKLNYQSSRSHCIYMIKVVRLNEDMSFTRVNRLSFCDLAGSERATKSKASGMRLKEACYINTSLLVLGRCLEQLRVNQTAKDKKMVPFRESKLTRLFSGHFLGKGKAVMIANASPCEYTFDETLNVLRFSAVAKELILNDSYIKMATNSLLSITDQWTQSKAQTSSFSLDQSSDFENSFIEEIKGKDELIEKLLDLADNLRSKLEEEQKQKAQLEITIRQDVLKEYSEYSDELLARQKENYDAQYFNLKKIYEQRIQDMEKLKDAKIKRLMEQLAEYEATSDDSINESIDNSLSSNLKATDTPQPSEQVKSLVDNDLEEDLDFVDASTELPNANKDLEEENRILKLDLCSVKNQLEMSSSELQKNSEEIVRLQNEIEKLNEQVSDMKNSSDELTNIKTEQQVEIEKLSSEIISLKEDLNVATTELSFTKEKLEEASLLLKESQSRESSSASKCEELEIKLQEALQVLEEYEKEIMQLKNAMSSVEQKSIELEDEKQKLSDTVFSLSAEIASITTNFEEIKAEKDNLKKINEELAETVKSEEHDLELKIKELNEKLDDAQTLIEKQEALNSQLKTDNDKLQDDYHALENKMINLTEIHEEEFLQRQNETNLKLTETMKEIEVLKSKIHEMEEDCKYHVEENLKLKEDLLKLENDFNAATNKIGSIVETEKQVEELKQKLEEANENLTVQKSKTFALESECEAYKNESVKLFGDCKSLEEEIKNNDVKITEMSKKLDDAQSLIEKQQASYSVLKTDNDSLQENCSSLEKKIANLIEMRGKESLQKQDKVNIKLIEALEQIETLNSKINKMEMDCKAHIEENLKLKEDFSNLETEFKTTTEKLVESSNNKRDEISLKLYEALEEIDTQNTKITKMELDCKTHQEDYDKLKKEYQDLESELEAITKEMTLKEEEIVELSCKLNESNHSLSSQKTELTDLLSEYETSKKENVELSEKCRDLEKLIESLKKEIETLMQEKHAIEETLNKIKSDAGNEDKNSTEIFETAEALNEKNAEISRLQSQCSSYQDEILKLKEMNLSMKENCDNLSAKLDTVKSESIEHEQKYINATNTLKELDSSLQKVQDLCSTYKNSLQKLEEEKKTLEKKCEELSCQINVEGEYKDQLAELRKDLESSEITIKELQNKALQLETELSANKEENLKLRADIANFEKEVKSLTKQLSADTNDINELKVEKQTLAKQISENQNLIQSVELCELKVSEKVKLLENQLEEHKKDIADRERQIREKEANITELEEALVGVQNEMKNLEKEHSKQMFALKQQHEIEVSESMKLKSVAEKENAELKSINKNLKRKAKERSSETKSKETSDVQKRRRPLRTRQAKVEKTQSDESISDDEFTNARQQRKRKSSEGFSPPKKTARVVKKTSSRAKNPVKKTEKTVITNTNVKENAENMSPVQKFAKFVGSTIRNVAESVTNMPSPRMTRGRRKRFNLEANSTSALPKWRY